MKSLAGSGPSMVSVVANGGGASSRHHGHPHGHSHHQQVPAPHGHSHGAVPRRQSSSLLGSLRDALRDALWSPARLLWAEARAVLWVRGGAAVRRITALAALNLCAAALLSHWCSVTNSLSLTAFCYLSWFHLLNLLTCYLSQWVSIKGDSYSSRSSGRATPDAASILRRRNQERGGEDKIRIQQEEGDGADPNLFTLGRGRYEVLAVFSSTVLSQLSGLFLLKESLERMLLESEEVHTGRLLLGALVCLVTQLATTYFAPSHALSHVIEVSHSSWLQEHTSDLAHSVCNVVPALTPFLLPRINPLALLSAASFAVVFLVDLTIQINEAHWCDPAAALVLSACLLGTMQPLTVYTGRVLLQTTPSHVVPQLDRLLREALTIDGVLEFKNEHFWTVSFGKLAGSLTVRIRKDADEQLVLAHITDRLSDLVWPLTIQILRDDHALAKLKQTSLRFLGATDAGDARLLRHHQSTPHLPRPPAAIPAANTGINHHSPMFTSPSMTGAARYKNGTGGGAFLSSTPEAPVGGGAGATNGGANGGASPGFSPLAAGANNRASNGNSPVLTSTPKEGEALKQRVPNNAANMLATPPAPPLLPPAPIPPGLVASMPVPAAAPQYGGGHAKHN